MTRSTVLLRDDVTGRELRFTAPREVIRAETAQEVPRALARIEDASSAGRWCAGYLSYEAGFALDPALHEYMPGDRRVPLVLMGVFDEPDDLKVALPAETAQLSGFRPCWTFEDYASRYSTIHGELRQGGLYQANLTFPITGRWKGDPAALFDAMTRRKPVRYAALVDLGGPVILSRSPELFFEVDAEGWIETHPMKGTIRRGTTPEEDSEMIETLRLDPKNQAENLMIVDLMRNDISRISEVGSVHVPELFRVESYPTVHQMVSHVRGRLKPRTSFGRIMAALFPCGSITGAPKIRAMQILSDLESQPRGVYCGAIGHVAPSGQMRFNVAIRTLTLHETGEAQLNVGSGLVFDSEARAEYDECLLKARFATGHASADPAAPGLIAV